MPASQITAGTLGDWSAALDSAALAADRLVLVVHGVGDPVPGGTVRPLARALAARGDQKLEPVQEVLWLPETPERHLTQAGRKVEVFPCHIQRIRNPRDKSETLLAEVHWSDLSSVRTGVLGAVTGFFKVVFGLRHVAAKASEPKPALQWLSNLIASLLRGPVAASNALLALATVVFGGLLALRDGENIEDPLAGALVAGLGLSALIVGSLVYRKRRGRAGGVFAFWTAFVGLLYILLPVGPYWLVDRSPRLGALCDELLARLGTGGEFDLTFYGFSMVLLVNFAWIATAIAMLPTVVAWAAALASARAEAHRPGINAAQVANAATAGLWFVAIPAFWLALFDRLPDSAKLPGFQRLLDEGLQLIGFYWGGALVVALIGVLTYARLWSWARKTPARSYDRNAPGPRLLVGRWLERVLILASLVGPLMVLLVTWKQMTRAPALTEVPEHPLEPDPDLIDRFLDLLQRGDVIAFEAGVILVALALALLPQLRVGLDIALDVINHFRQEPDGAVPEGPQPNPESEATTPFVRRELIRRRLRKVLMTTLPRVRPTELTVLAHSQGTIAAIDVLREGPSWPGPGKGKPRCRLVTMGSPFTHLYQHYFPTDYPQLTDRYWQALERLTRGSARAKAPGKSRWFNIFRVDDFVGTHIGDQPISRQPTDWPFNIAVDRGGHTDYWTDRQVLDLLVGKRIRLLG